MPRLSDFALAAEINEELAAFLRRPLVELREKARVDGRTWLAVETAARTLDLSTLRDLCSARVDAYLRRSHGTRVLNDAVRGLKGLIGTTLGDSFVHGEADDEDGGERREAGPVIAPRMAARRSEVSQWAEEAGVADLVSMAAQTFSPRQYPQLRPLFGGADPTVLEALAIDDEPLVPNRKNFGSIRGNIAAAIRDRLEHIARNRVFLRQLDERHPRVDDTLADPGVAELAAALRGARQKLGDVPERVPGWFVPAPLRFAAAPPRLLYDEAESASSPMVLGHGTPHLVTLGLDRLAAGRVDAKCSCFDAREGCAHVPAALDAALDLLVRPSMPAHGELREHLATPPWQRLLKRIEQQLQELPSRARSTDQRLIWVLKVTKDHGEHEVVLDPVIQRRNARGAWLKGMRASLSDIKDEPGLTADPVDARVLEMLADSDEWSLELTPARVFRALGALTGAPNVFLEDRRDAPVAIRRLQIGIALDEIGETRDGVTPSPAAFTLRLRLGDAPIAPAALLAACEDGDGPYIALDPKSNECRLALVPPEVAVLARALSSEPTFTVPAAEADRLLARLERVQAAAPFIIPDSLGGQTIEPDARLLCRLTPLGENGLSLDVRCRPLHEADPLAPGDGARLLFAMRDGARVSVHRDLEAERERAHQLVEALGIPETARTAPWRYQLDELELALDVVAALRARAASPGDVVVEWPDEAWRLKSASPRDMRLSVVQRRDWFGVEGGIEVDGELLNIAALLDAVRARRRWVALGAGRFARIEDELRRRLESAQDMLLPARGGVELGAADPEGLANLVDDPGHLDQVPSYHELCARRARAREHQPETPAHLRGTLRPYQVEGFQWLSRLAAAGTGACLADDMGLGKTLQLLTVLQERAAEGPALVIAPTSVVSNWMAEAERFAPGLRRVLYRGTDRARLLGKLGPGDLVVTSYALAVRDAEALAKVRFAALVMDEAQALKNAQTRRARAIRTLDAAWRIALTGTPIENHLGELWSLYRIVSPALFGSWEHFRARYAYPIERQNDAARRAALSGLLRPFLLRRTKQEVAPELPSKTELNNIIDLTPGERRLYEAARVAAVAELAGGPQLEAAAAAAAGGDGGVEDGKRRIQILAALTRLRQLACHPALVDDKSREPSSKLRVLVELLTTLKETGHRALVFSQFVRFLDLARAALEQAGIKLLKLDGSTPAEQRATLIQQFQSGAADAFLISLKAGGTGLNLTEADYVVHLDPWWNPAVEDQATDRTHRIGQTKPVTVIRLVARGTVEEAVLSLHADKRALASSVLEGADGAVRLGNDELLSLLATGSDTELAEEAAEDAAAEAPTPAAADSDDSAYG